MDTKTVITGTGRCGTTFLIQLLTNLGLETGYTKEECEQEFNKIDGLRGGIEHALGDNRIDKARFIENPAFAKVEEFKKLSEKYDIDHVYIPIRDLDATAKCRELMSKNTHAGYGGFWLDAKSVEDQKTANAKLVYNFLHHLSTYDFTFTLLSFTDMMSYSDYLYEKMEYVMNISHIEYLRFQNEYYKLINSEFIRF